MKKALFCACVLIGTFAGAATPNELFYLPGTGQWMMEGTSQWTRAYDKTGTDTATALTGMYGIDGGKAGFVRVSNLWGDMPFLLRQNIGTLPAIPEIGARILDKFMGLDTALEMAYGVGRFSSDRREYDSFSMKLALGKKTGALRTGVYGKGARFFHFHKNAGYFNQRLKNATSWAFGGQVAYDIAQNWTIQGDYEHTFKERFAVLSAHQSVKNPADTLGLTVSYEFKPGAFISPYGRYTWLDKKSGLSNIKVFGVKVAVEF